MPYDIIVADDLQYTKKLELLDYEINKKYYQKYYQKALNDFKAINDKETLIDYLKNIQEEIIKANKNHELINLLVKKRNKK